MQNKKKRRIFRLFFADGEKDKGKIGGFYREKAKNGDFIYPGLFGSLISTVIISVGLFVFDWRMTLASLWVVPVSLIIVLFSYKVQDMRESVRPRAIAYG